jgi:hypothetical protein
VRYPQLLTSVAIVVGNIFQEVLSALKQVMVFANVFNTFLNVVFAFGLRRHFVYNLCTEEAILEGKFRSKRRLFNVDLYS